jgi:protease-4
MSNQTTTQQPQWEQQTIEKILLEHINEQRRTRKWSLFFKLINLTFFILIFLFFFGAFSKDLPQPNIQGKHTAVIDIRGEIDSKKETSADNIRAGLKAAFENTHVKGVILRINSPGGSPVQARQVYDEIKFLRKKYPHTKIYAAIEEVGASAAYLIASATDEIYADETSLVGSIGALISSFGFVDVMQKIGVERRLYASGKYKGILDPFSPRSPEQDAILNKELEIVHAAFIQNVREGRGNRLKETEEIFSGLFWSGKNALSLGLIDGFGEAEYIAREVIGAERIVDYTPTMNFLDKLTHKMGTGMGQALLTAMGVKEVGH